jgi:hypothetical protein
MSSIQALTQAIQDLEKITRALRNECDAMQAAEVPPPPMAVDEIAPVVEALYEVAEETGTKVSSRNSRASDFALILSHFPGRNVYIEMTGDKWVGSLCRTGINYEGRNYGTPGGFCAAHAKRITARHAKPTKPGSAWALVKMLEGDFKDQCLDQVAKELRGRIPIAMVGGGAATASNEIPVVTRPVEGTPLAITPNESIPFVCVIQKNGIHRGIFQIPTSADVAERGGRWENGRFKFNSGKADAFSPSGACITVLRRAEGSKTNCWQGTTHVLLYVGGSWKPYREVVGNAD